ncbi:E3 ubiquitin-protein ligase RNF25-like [Artemia franciscana]
MDLENSVVEEVEALQAIFLDSVDVERDQSGIPLLVRSTLYPATAEDSSQQYVCTDLEISLPKGYPDVSPTIRLRNSRGLSDLVIKQIEEACKRRCVDFKGNPILYELFELVKDHLTNSNRPAGDCPICLFGFHPNDDFVHTECYHHFHKHCLYRYIISTKRGWNEEDQELISHGAALHLLNREERKVLCPMCRLTIDLQEEDLANAQSPVEYSQAPESYVTSEDISNIQKGFQSLYLKQKMKGAIIDPTEEPPVLVLNLETSVNSEEPSTSTAHSGIVISTVPAPLPIENSGKYLPKGPNIKSRKFRDFNLEPKRQWYRNNSHHDNKPWHRPTHRKTDDTGYNSKYNTSDYSYGGYYKPYKHFRHYRDQKYGERTDHDKFNKKESQSIEVKDNKEVNNKNENGKRTSDPRSPPPGFENRSVPPGFERKS